MTQFGGLWWAPAPTALDSLGGTGAKALAATQELANKGLATKLAIGSSAPWRLCGPWGRGDDGDALQSNYSPTVTRSAPLGRAHTMREMASGGGHMDG